MVHTVGTRVLGQLNLLLVSGPHRLHQKMIEKKGDLVIDRSLLHRTCMREGVKQLVVFVCQFLCLFVSLSVR